MAAARNLFSFRFDGDNQWSIDCMHVNCCMQTDRKHTYESFMKYILYVNNYKHGDGANPEVVCDRYDRDIEWSISRKVGVVSSSQNFLFHVTLL